MRPDIVELTAFYDSKDGEFARRLINHQLRLLWPDLTGKALLGIGYATPFLGLFEEADRKVAFMPATQGARAWPRGNRNRVALGREDELPFEDRSFDHLILAHAFECSPHANRLMREAWRVLNDGGRLVIIVPNRRGLWCWSERTPMGFGQPYTSDQLARSLRNNLFTAGELRRALYMPPLGRILPRGRRLARQFSMPIERLGLKLLPHFAGVLIAEAIKDVYNPTPVAAMARPASRRYVPVPEGVTARGETRSLVLHADARQDVGHALPDVADEAIKPRPWSLRRFRSVRSGTASSGTSH
jgi:SAM-dependent methyltransferase